MRSDATTKRLVSVLIVAVVAGIFALTRSAPSQPATKPAPAAAEQSASESNGDDAATPAADAIHASNQRALRVKIGSEVLVTGDVARASKSQSGIHFLNLENSQLTIVCFRDDAKKFAKGAPSDQFRDQQIEIRGKLEEYKGKLQIKLVDPDQIRIVASDTDKPGAQPQGVELKQVGATSWISPAGLRYEGRDPAGMNRKEHIERHVRDQPDRVGSHGVFDGGAAVAFAVIDEAWLRAEKQRVRPKNEGDRSSLLVPMGRRVGFLGGQSGKERRHPPLKRVFIVFETGTKKIITAFPR